LTLQLVDIAGLPLMTLDRSAVVLTDRHALAVTSSIFTNRLGSMDSILPILMQSMDFATFISKKPAFHEQKLTFFPLIFSGDRI
jgi:hypothetical protein